MDTRLHKTLVGAHCITGAVTNQAVRSADDTGRRVADVDESDRAKRAVGAG